MLLGVVRIRDYNTTQPSMNGIHVQKVDAIRASNPCSEYMFLDNTACNLASMNFVDFYNEETNRFNVEGYEYVTRLMDSCP
jgi:ribonucleoside-diphosphate reductase alpha chain